MPVQGQMVIPIKAANGAPEYQGKGGVYTPGQNGAGQLSDSAARIAGEGYRAQNQAAQAGTEALARSAGAVDKAVKTGLSAYQEYQAAMAQNALSTAPALLARASVPAWAA